MFGIHGASFGVCRWVRPRRSVKNNALVDMMADNWRSFPIETDQRTGFFPSAFGIHGIRRKDTPRPFGKASDRPVPDPLVDRMIGSRCLSF